MQRHELRVEVREGKLVYLTVRLQSAQLLTECVVQITVALDGWIHVTAATCWKRGSLWVRPAVGRQASFEKPKLCSKHDMLAAVYTVAFLWTDCLES